MSYDLLFQQALRLHESGHFDEAEQIYRQILETAPDNPDVLNLLGLIAQAKGIHNQAVELFYKAVRQAPRHAPFYFNLALSLDAWGKYQEALDNYEKALKLSPELKEAFNNIGNIYKKLGSRQKAADNYRKAAALDDNYAEPRANLAMLDRDQTALEELTRRFPDDALSFYFLAIINYENGKTDKAGKYAEQADRLSPCNDSIKLLSGLIFLKQNQMAKAKICFEKALIYNPLSTEAHINLANIETNLGDFETAEQHYLRALDIDPSALDAHINYADMLYRQKRLHEALEEYRKAVILNPGVPEISNNLALFLKDLGEYEEALGLLFNALLKRPQQEEFSINTAETLTALFRQKPDDARKIAAKWIAFAPENPFARRVNAAFNGETDLENNQIYAEKLFDHFADNYELVLKNIDYGVVRSLRDLTGNVEGTLVDLGCGTGLAGEAYQAPGARLIGVDISEKMLQKASEKGIYEKLIKSDIAEYLKTKPRADLFLAADVFAYLGNIEPVIKAVAPQKIAFSTENSAAPEYTLTSSGRFAHNPAYIQNLLHTHGYADITKKTTTLRQENGRPVDGTLWLAR